MKKIITLLLLINSFLISCTKESIKDSTNNKSISLNIKDKKLNNFFKGSRFHSLKGIVYKKGDTSYKFKIKNKVLNLKIKNDYINGFSEGWLLGDSISFFLHDLNTISSIPLDISFNKYKKTLSYFLPSFFKDNLEILKNRSSNIYKLDKNLNLIPVYSANDSIDLPSNINDIIFHTSTKKNLKKLNALTLKPESFGAILIIHNPLNNLYTLLPDFDEFSNNNLNILSEIESHLNYNSFTTYVNKDTIYLDGLIHIPKTLTYENKKIIIKRGTKFIFQKGAKLIFRSSNVDFMGSSKLPIVLEGLSENSIYFSDCDYININFSNFSNFSNFIDDSITLPSAITFYNSNVFIENSRFKDNLQGDDYLNFYNSYFEIKNCVIENSLADAIDSDFSQGKITRLSLFNIGNDGLDFSGSKVSVSYCV
ncbi:hypothetical protein N9600_06100, partial [Flavobacteriaceae bacterium]|nr:hypothetical protein [Flavobacteriaceae bacterium]